MDLDSLKYAELQRLAKTIGLKANVKADKLLNTIKQHYQQNQEPPQPKHGQGNENGPVDVVEEENSSPNLVQEEKNGTSEEPAFTMSLFVNKRRGKATKTKRKYSDSETKTASDTQLLPDAIEDGEGAASSADGGTKNPKRTRLCSPRVSRAIGTPEEEPLASSDKQQSEIKDEVPALADKDGKPPACKIPRYEALKKKQGRLLKPATPNFKKLHEAHFNKMESIDLYVQRKTKQMETYRNEVKQLKLLSEKTISKPADGKMKAANPCGASIFSPVAVNKRPAEDKRGRMLPASKPQQSKPARKEDASFRPSVLSTRRINVRFSQATHDENKRSLVKTPVRMSPCVASSTPRKQTSNGGRLNSAKTSTASATKTPGPFVFTGNTSVSNTPGTNKKLTFDLKASLSRPLAYKPHKGKLKPFGESKENAEKNQPPSSHSRQKRYKQHQVQTREERRATHLDGRKQKKERMLGARRGLLMT
ncbi:nucleolar and spindle-associated protein 1 [Lampris incognitus]|uniref:nucleolar and spindle-associated protein 1 n=1 Tax=Lampris incognitus TaxID=2546036 RepID=UPI0024B5438C|nr:nucleolar and spindle-associated protein 1 [Lampris incognitus]